MSLKFAPGMLIDTLDRTLGRTLDLAPVPAESAWDAVSPTAGTWRLPMLDDSGDEIGIVVADTGAVVLLGGTLIMLPESSMREQVADGQPSPPVLEAYAEVINVLRGVVNNTQRNPHVVPGLLEPGGAGAGWRVDPQTRLDLAAETPIGAVRLSFLSR
ncbi:MAG: hypothetical protein IPI34_00525 [bacterium]|nr:hypothetical protein [bacterium]